MSTHIIKAGIEEQGRSHPFTPKCSSWGIREVVLEAAAGTGAKGRALT